MAGDLNWTPDNVRRLVEAETAKRLEAASVIVLNRARTLLSVPGTGLGPAKGKGKSKRQVRIYGANPSRPGEPPRKQRGRLRASVARSVDRKALTARVGTNIAYGRYLELGTRWIAPRPWLRRALAESRAEIDRLFGHGG